MQGANKRTSTLLKKAKLLADESAIDESATDKPPNDKPLNDELRYKTHHVLGLCWA